MDRVLGRRDSVQTVRRARGIAPACRKALDAVGPPVGGFDQLLPARSNAAGPHCRTASRIVPWSSFSGEHQEGIKPAPPSRVAPTRSLFGEAGPEPFDCRV